MWIVSILTLVKKIINSKFDGAYPKAELNLGEKKQNERNERTVATGSHLPGVPYILCWAIFLGTVTIHPCLHIWLCANCEAKGGSSMHARTFFSQQDEIACSIECTPIIQSTDIGQIVRKLSYKKASGENRYAMCRPYASTSHDKRPIQNVLKHGIAHHGHSALCFPFYSFLFFIFNSIRSVVRFSAASPFFLSGLTHTYS